MIDTKRMIRRMRNKKEEYMHQIETHSSFFKVGIRMIDLCL